MHNTNHPTMNGEWLHTTKKENGKTQGRGKLQSDYCIVSWEPESSEETKPFPLRGRKTQLARRVKKQTTLFPVTAAALQSYAGSQPI